VYLSPKLRTTLSASTCVGWNRTAPLGARRPAVAWRGSAAGATLPHRPTAASAACCWRLDAPHAERSLAPPPAPWPRPTAAATGLVSPPSPRRRLRPSPSLSLSLSRSTCLPRWATLLRPTTPRCASTSLYLDLQPRRSPAHNSCRRPHRAAASAHSPNPRAKRRQGPTPPPPRHDSRQHQCLLQPPSLLLGGWHVWCLGA
jgi:hypothetical protein